MSAPNGGTNGSVSTAANGNAGEKFSPLDATTLQSGLQFSMEQIKELTAALELPFDPQVIEWRVTNTTKAGKPRGQVIPYADQRAYTDRLNALLTPAGWTRKYVMYTSANFQRGKDQKTVAKVFITCELTIFGLNTHSATGEEWADDDNAGTSAEAQAFKRACACFGLGRYLYYFEGAWVDLDDRKRPRNVPQLPKWATPQGWLQGLRPFVQAPFVQAEASSPNANPNASVDGRRNDADQNTQSARLISEIESMAKALGPRLYRGLLRTLANAWTPGQIKDVTLQHKVLEHMQCAERGLRRLQAALEKTGPQVLDPVLQSLQLKSLNQIESLETLKRIVVALEAKADKL